MKLERLTDFQWYNEPSNVVFEQQNVTIVAKPQTDFWQSFHHNIQKDNAHLFYKTLQGDFELIVKWCFDTAESFNQCGIAVRVDAKNWFKASVMSKSKKSPAIGSCLTIGGFSDLANVSLSKMPDAIFYKLQRKDNDFICSYSLDGQTYIRLRQFYLRGISSDIKAGAYIAAPQNAPFQAVLDEIDFK